MWVLYLGTISTLGSRPWFSNLSHHHACTNVLQSFLVKTTSTDPYIHRKEQYVKNALWNGIHCRLHTSDLVNWWVWVQQEFCPRRSFPVEWTHPCTHIINPPGQLHKFTSMNHQRWSQSVPENSQIQLSTDFRGSHLVINLYNQATCLTNYSIQGNMHTIN